MTLLNLKVKPKDKQLISFNITAISMYSDKFGFMYAENFKDSNMKRFKIKFRFIEVMED